uniref:Uncharacterized protein n=1 Tax=Populus alba TaxID=43335 RepID=A0A4U5MNB8_POPAL|nr:hypothetical protein D5086_0000304740 [Populus alba]
MAADQGKSMNIVHRLSSLPVLEQRDFDGLGKDSITGLRSASEHNIRDSNPINSSAAEYEYLIVVQKTGNLQPIILKAAEVELPIPNRAWGPLIVQDYEGIFRSHPPNFVFLTETKNGSELNYPNSLLLHLDEPGSDHRPIFLLSDSGTRWANSLEAKARTAVSNSHDKLNELTEELCIVEESNLSWDCGRVRELENRIMKEGLKLETKISSLLAIKIPVSFIPKPPVEGNVISCSVCMMIKRNA